MDALIFDQIGILSLESFRNLEVTWVLENIEARDEKGRTPVMFAAYIGKLEIARHLVSMGASMEAEDHNGRTVEQYLKSTGVGLRVEDLRMSSNKSLLDEIMQNNANTALPVKRAPSI